MLGSRAGLRRESQALPHAAGVVNSVWRGPDREIRGWILDPARGPFDQIDVLVDGSRVGEAEPGQVPGVERALPWIRDAGRASFVFRLGPGSDRPGSLELIAGWDGAAAARHTSLFRSPADDQVPVPPVTIASPSTGVARTADAARGGGDWFREIAFLAGGMTAAAGVLDQIELHGGGPRGSRLLDWGCGCGRVTRHLLDKGFDSVAGCDLDSEAISWCRQNLPGAEFFVSPPEPPLPIEDASLDVIIGCSVVTHLDAPRQARWLAELRRVTVPGGLVLLSTQGDFAYRRGAIRRRRVLQRWPWAMRRQARRLSAELARRGLIDRGATRALEGIAPSGYYRSVAQSADYTRQAWSPHFEILDHVECGLDGNQDLVVMRRP